MSTLYLTLLHCSAVQCESKAEDEDRMMLSLTGSRQEVLSLTGSRQEDVESIRKKAFHSLIPHCEWLIRYFLRL